MKIFILLIPSILLANTLTPTSVEWMNYQASVARQNDGSYLMLTNHPLRDGLPVGQRRVVPVIEDLPQMETGSALFDGIWAMTMEEVRENSVAQIRDSAFEEVDCQCFETGRKWNYVWTRDIAYATHLGLNALDPMRSLNSLLFKVSSLRGSNDLTNQIIQDTGTGGSWPISSDRVIWALGARDLINYLPRTVKNSFLAKAYVALKNTINHDRQTIYDANYGLYTGEQSFLDWREQSYPGWVSENVIHVGMSMSLSTNVAHYIAITTLSEIALELGRIQEFNLFHQWSLDLKNSINSHFWDSTSGLYRTYLMTFLARNDVDKYDLLGNALAAISGVAETEAQLNVMANYPMVKAGPPVMHPQDQVAPIYHNRGIWPFVTQYGLMAAVNAKQAPVVNHLISSMIKGAALNLSNMENFEFLSLNNWQQDGALSGPVVNSQRQLWSVAAMANLGLNSIFGKKVSQRKIGFNPFITEKTIFDIFKGQSDLKLNNFRFINKTINVQINLPNVEFAKETAYYEASELTLNDVTYPIETMFAEDELDAVNDIIINLDKRDVSELAINRMWVDSSDQLDNRIFEQLFAPKTPRLRPIKIEDNKATLYFDSQSYRNIGYIIYKNGEYLTEVKNQNRFQDTRSEYSPACYVVEAYFESSYIKSLPSEPHCYWPRQSIKTYPVTNSWVRSNTPPLYYSDQGKIYIRNWGEPHERLTFGNVSPYFSGTYALQLNYNNPGLINTGITAITKKVEVRNSGTGELVKEGLFMMPHHLMRDFWRDSNFIHVELDMNEQYEVTLSDSPNMSYFEHFENYLFHGGRGGAFNRVNISELKLLLLKRD